MQKPNSFEVSGTCDRTLHYFAVLPMLVFRGVNFMMVKSHESFIVFSRKLCFLLDVTTMCTTF